MPVSRPCRRSRISTPLARGVRRWPVPRTGSAWSEIVRAHPGADEPAEQRLEDVRVVVDAGEEDRLVHHREAAVREARAGGDGLARELLRVIEMRHHPDRVMLAERANELRGDAHGERHRDARREADRLDGGDGADAPEQAIEALGRHGERVAAAHDDVADLGMRGDPGERGLEALDRDGTAAVADDARTRAEPAVDGAAVGREEQHAVRIATHEMRRDLVLDLAERVDEVAGDLVGLVDARHALPAHGTRGIVRIAERQVIRGDRDRQPLALGAPRALELLGREVEHACELIDGADALAELSLPAARRGEPPAGEPLRHLRAAALAHERGR